MRKMRAITLRITWIALLVQSIKCLECQKSAEHLSCSFSLPLDSLDTHHRLEQCFDGYCVSTEVKVRGRNEDANDHLSLDSFNYDENNRLHSSAKVQDILARRPVKTDSAEFGGWLVELGIAYREKSMVPSEKEILAALHSFEQALLLYERIGNMDKSASIKFQAAACLAHIAETKMVHPDFRPDAADWFRKSESMYRETLQQHEDVRPDAEMSWADTLIQIAVLSLETTASSTAQLQDFFEAPDQRTIEEAERMIETALDVFRGTSEGDNEFELMRKVRIGDSLQTYASLILLSSFGEESLQRLVKTLGEAILSYEAAFQMVHQTHNELSNIVLGLAETYYSLADAYMQLGKYEEAKSTYNKAMLWHLDHNVEIPPIHTITDDLEEAIKSHEEALSEYMDSSYGGYELDGPAQYRKTPGGGRDELYEADLHATLGALHLSRDDIELALQHFTRAYEIYGKYPGNEEKRAAGDVKLNMALAAYRQGSFHESIKAYGEAMETYRIVVGEGVNPVMDGLQAWSDVMGRGDLAQTDLYAGDETDQQPLINLDSLRNVQINLTQGADEL